MIYGENERNKEYKEFVVSIKTKYGYDLYSLLQNLIEYLEFKKINSEIFNRIKRKYNLDGYYIPNWCELENYLYWGFIVDCIIFYFDYDELKYFSKLCGI